MSGMFRTHCNALWQTQSLARQGDRASSESRRGRKTPKLADEKALEARARHEYHGWSLAHCASHYQTTVNYMRQILNYHSRSKLVARPEHANL